MSHPVRDTYRWKQARKRARAGVTHCSICSLPLDPDAPPRSRWSTTVDHIVPLAQGGDPYSQSNLACAHYGCNARKGDGSREVQPPAARQVRASWW